MVNESSVLSLFKKNSTTFGDENLILRIFTRELPLFFSIT